jgi:CRP/FNR family transcriptional regulator
LKTYRFGGSRFDRTSPEHIKINQGISMSVSIIQTHHIFTKVPYVSSEAPRQRAGHFWSSLADICNLLHVSGSFLASEPEVTFKHVRIKSGQRLYTAGQSFDALYIVNSGFFKTVLLDDSGNEQVLSFPMKGDVLGVDGIHSKKYMSEAVALSNCDVIIVPFKVFISLGQKYPELETSLYRIMSQELIRDHTVATMLGSLSAEARVARFLTTLSERFADLGYSSREFNLRMTRKEIGSYLGLSLETASRTLCALSKAGYIVVKDNGRSVCILDPLTLKTLRHLSPSKVRNAKTASAVPVIALPSHEANTTVAA